MLCRSSISIIFIALLAVGCSDKKSKDSTVIVKSLSFSEKNCKEPYQTYFTGTILPLVQATLNTQSYTVSLNLYKDWTSKNSFYRFTEHCMLGEKSSCLGIDQVSFQKSGSSTYKYSLAVSGQFVVIDPKHNSLFDDINFNSLSSLGLKTEDKKSINAQTIFEPPNKERNSVLGTSLVTKQVEPGRIFLALIDDDGMGNTYELYKIRIEQVGSDETINLRYQKIAEIDANSYRNYYCSKQSEINSSQATRMQGEDVIVLNPSGSDRFSTFSITKGVNGFDGRFIGIAPDLYFSYYPSCGNDKHLPCTSMSFMGSGTELTSIIETNLTSIDDVLLSDWPQNYNIEHHAGWMPLKTNSVYLFSEENSFRKLKGAIQVVETDPAGKWVSIRWKRVTLQYTTR